MAAEAAVHPSTTQLPLSILKTDIITVESEATSTLQPICLPPAPLEVCRLVQEVIQEHITARPNAPAICSWDGYFTYKELDQLSSRLAVHISSFGVGPDVVVPILCDQSAITIIAMLAVCKAGGAFAALDASHPHGRLTEIIQDTKATLLLASPNQSHRFSGSPGLSVVEVSNSMVASLSSAPESLGPHPDASPSDIMYIVFTSGSTGRPKGVMIEHRAYVTSVLAHGADQGINEKSRVLQFASYAFDMSILEIFTTLVFGGCICVPTDEERFGGIADFINKTGVNTLMLTPSYAKLLDPTTLPSVRTLITGGEVVPSNLVETWSPHVEVYSLYGAAEAAVQAAGIRLGTGTMTPVTGLIGNPTACNIWIVREDNHNKLVSVGEIGEVLIEGNILARGYMGDETKTKAAFVDFCIGSETRRAYKTGDLVRRAAGGTAIFIGRKDTQVKVQGIRVELTEIEARLSKSQVLPSGSNFCVEKIQSTSSPNQASLAAFISPSVKISGGVMPEVCWDQVQDILARVPKIRESLSKVLPAPLVPSLYVPLTFIPLTSSTKTNRKALRELVKELSLNEVQKLQQFKKSQGSTRSLSPSEKTMSELWALVLNRDPETIGPDDNFIHLGGDSVTSIKLVSAARDRGVGLTSSMILSTPVLSDLAKKALSDAPSKQERIQPFELLGGFSEELCATAAAVCGLQSAEIEDVLPMTMSQMRWYAKTLVKPDAWLDQHHFRLPSDVDLVLFESALNSTIKAAELLRARVMTHPDRKLLQVIVKFRPVEAVIVNDTLEAYLKRDLEIPMAIGCSLSRYAIVRGVNSSEKVFVWTIHHAIYDGYAISMLLHTINEFYHGLKPIPFTPFSRYLKGPSEHELAGGETFWKHYLADSSWAEFPILPPPERKLAPSMERSLRAVSIVSEQPSSGTTEGAASITVANLIRVAYATALSSYSADPTSILFLESLGGRNSTFPGIDRVAGPTLLTCPTRIHLPSSKSCNDVLAEAQASLIGRMEFEDFPLARLLRLLPSFELRSVLMIEDETFLPTGNGEGLFGDGATELRLDESDAMPMLLRCTIRGSVMDVDVRFDKHVIQAGAIDTFMETFERFFEEFLRGDRNRSFGEILAL